MAKDASFSDQPRRTNSLLPDESDPWAGDDAWSVGCRAYAFSKHQLARAAESGRYPWLGILDETHHFVFLVDGVPVRFYRGDADDPSKRTLRQQESEAEQLALALGGDDAERLMFRLAVETEADGSVRRVVFLALRGEEGHVECFWPVSLAEELDVMGSGRRNSGAVLQLPLSSAGVGPARKAERRRRGEERDAAGAPGRLVWAAAASPCPCRRPPGVPLPSLS